MTHPWRWVFLAALSGFSASFVCSSILNFSRAAFVVTYSIIAAAFVGAYTAYHKVSWQVQVKRRWLAGLLGGVLLGVVLTMQVTSQPASARPAGFSLVRHLVGYGILYGTVDALLLSVVPVLALYGSRARAELQNAAARLRAAGAALLGSALVTAAYHAGFAEFRGPQLLDPIVGNSVMTLAYLLTGNPLAAIVSHVVMHGAAVLHGMETTVQLPPHY